MIRQRLFSEILSISQVLIVLVLAPMVIFTILAGYSPVILFIVYYGVVSVFIFQAFLSYVNSISAFRTDSCELSCLVGSNPIPKTTFLVVAYLPNEIAVVEDTLLHILRNVARPAAGIEVILCYNTPQFEPIEKRMRELAYQWPELILANAYGSRSKSENLNYVLDLISGQMVVLFDSDHRVAPDCLCKAWRWLDAGYDVVQGRCIIRNAKEGIVPALVSIEFEVIYGVNHYSKTKLYNSALFGGSNGYWKTEVLRKVRFRENCLTEDIDATLRALISGVKFVHDRSIISTELAPVTLVALWFQRKRWAQGWYQCSLTYQKDIFHSKILSFRQKFLWTTLLMWRIVYDFISHLLFPVVFAYWIYRGTVAFPMNFYIWFALIVTILSGPVEAATAFKNAAAPRPSVWRFLMYSVLHFPYTMFKNLIQSVAIRDEIAGVREWVVSARRSK